MCTNFISSGVGIGLTRSFEPTLHMHMISPAHAYVQCNARAFAHL